MNPNFQTEYRTLFQRLGFPLNSRDGVTEHALARAEKKLGVKFPKALRDFYLVAGRERVLNQIFNRLRSPEELAVENGKLVFLEENQCVVVWGIGANSRVSNDPAVFQGPVTDGEITRWYPEVSKCSMFLKFMLHLQAAYGGGMPYTNSAPAVPKSQEHLKKNWEFAGEVNGMSAFSRPGQAACAIKCPEPGSSKKRWRIFAGAHTSEGLNEIAAELQLSAAAANHS